VTLSLTDEEEGLHSPGPERWWNESWYFDFARDDGSFGGYVRLGLNPNQGTSWFLLCLVGDDLDGTVRIDDKAAPVGGLTVSSDAWSFELSGKDGTWTVVGSGAASASSPAEILTGGTLTSEVPIALDLTWSADGQPFRYDVTTRYELPCLVSGTVTVDGRVFSLEEVEGQRDHSWGVRDWQAAGWCWASARLADGSRLHVTDVLLPDFRFTTGYLQDAQLEPVTDVVRTDAFDDLGLPTVSHQVLQPSGLELTITSLLHAPTVMTGDDGRCWPFQRSLARFETTAGAGIGWIEWNRIDHVLTPSGS
jgi:hypothetical protein